MTIFQDQHIQALKTIFSETYSNDFRTLTSIRYKQMSHPASLQNCVLLPRFSGRKMELGVNERNGPTWSDISTSRFDKRIALIPTQATRRFVSNFGLLPGRRSKNSDSRPGHRPEDDQATDPYIVQPQTSGTPSREFKDCLHAAQA